MDRLKSLFRRSELGLNGAGGVFPEGRLEKSTGFSRSAARETPSRIVSVTGQCIDVTVSMNHPGVVPVGERLYNRPEPHIVVLGPRTHH